MARVRGKQAVQGDDEQWYVGETGIAIGLDLKWTETISFAVLSTTREFTPEGDLLSGSHSGAKADAAAGVAVGAALLISGSEDTTALTAARARVDAAHNHPFAGSAVGDTAAVQAYFDRWLGGEVAPADSGQAVTCKNYFEIQMATLERFLSSRTSAAQMERKLMEPRWWTVYFDTDSRDVGMAGEATATEVAALFRNYKEARVYVRGHTDAVGSREYNLTLSKERADNVQTTLVRAGVPLGWIRPVGYGKKNPVQFSSNPYDATNRRVDIVVEPLSVKLK